METSDFDSSLGLPRSRCRKQRERSNQTSNHAGKASNHIMTKLKIVTLALLLATASAYAPPPPPGSCFYQTMGWASGVSYPATGIRKFSMTGVNSWYSGMSLRYKSSPTGNWTSLGSTQGTSLNGPAVPGTFEMTENSSGGCFKVETFNY